MPAPRRLLHPVPVYIKQVNKRFTAYDDDLKEPLGEARRETTIRLQAQMNIQDTTSPRATAGGVDEVSTGYCLFLTSDLRKRGVTIQRGDRIVQIGDPPNARETDLYITKFQWKAHYQSAGGPTFLRAFFKDRNA